MVKVNYQVAIERPKQHLIEVKMHVTQLKGNLNGAARELKVFLPSWTPGSYLMREYAGGMTQIGAEDQKGKRLEMLKTAKGKWTISLADADPIPEEITIDYKVYAQTLSVRTSEVNIEHAFLHGPTFLLGLEGHSMKDPTIELKFPPLWSKVSTALKDISPRREQFLYQASCYDTLVDSPIEIGCHETDGFMSNKIPHEIAIYGEVYPHDWPLKKDMQTITDYIASITGDVPFDNYSFLIQFAREQFGGLEHLNSTALVFDGRILHRRKDYLDFLSLVAHEYFHVWNGKRIRPKELGPFDYCNENYTSMLWLVEGLTKFLDDFTLPRTGLCTTDEYLEMMKTTFNRYLQTPGRRFQSLEESSYDAWIKLYRSHANSSNSGVSYYLKGGIVFLCLHIMLKQQGKDIHHLVQKLWQSYKERPETGLVKEEVMVMVQELGGEEVRKKFEIMIETTEDIDLEGYLKDIGLKVQWLDTKDKQSLGFTYENREGRMIVRTVLLDGAGMKAGLAPGDEIIAINKVRVLYKDADQLASMLKPNTNYELLFARYGKLIQTEFIPDSQIRLMEKIEVANQDLCDKNFFKVS